MVGMPSSTHPPMVASTVQNIIAQLSTLSQGDREEALGEILNHFCVGCGAEGDFLNTTCDCPPRWAREEAEAAE